MGGETMQVRPDRFGFAGAAAWAWYDRCLSESPARTRSPHRRRCPGSNCRPRAGPGAARLLRRRLVDWYRVHQRKLPWRTVAPAPANPYYLLVSEAMLQQTQVGTVVPYFQRFVAALPTIGDLAAAPEQQVLRLWQGLGYYRRAHHLHAAAKLIVEAFGGRIPDTAQQLMVLPGVGRYSAGAIASIGFGRAEPVLDGNVTRVLARWFAIEQSVDETQTRNHLWELAGQLADGPGPGEINQALMELGALVCTPQAPKCARCPVRRLCQARRLDRVHAVPQRTVRRSPRLVTHAVIALERRGRYLFEQRPRGGLWSSMWQLPTVEGAALSTASLRARVRRHLGLQVINSARVGQFTHRTTHLLIRFVIWLGQANGGRLRRGHGHWRRLHDLEDLPLANPQRRAIAILRNRG